MTIQLLCQPGKAYLPQAFTQRVPCEMVTHPKAQSVFPLFFTLSGPLPHSFNIQNVHGSHVVVAQNDVQQADAHVLWVDEENRQSLLGRSLALQTADCLPIGFSAYHNGVYFWGLCHAGWRGLTQGIVTNTIQSLLQGASSYGIAPREFLRCLQVHVGPAIFGMTYQCGAIVESALRQHRQRLQLDSTLDETFAACADVQQDRLLAQLIPSEQRNESSIFPDIGLLATVECLHAGIPPENIAVLRTNTYGHKLFPSFREHTHTNGTGKGARFWTHLPLC